MAEATALYLFSFFSLIRIAGYFPQIVQIAAHAGPAKAVSAITWSLFGLSNGSTVLYAWVCLADWRMVAVFSMNTLCCSVIVALLAVKRRTRSPGQVEQRSIP